MSLQLYQLKNCPACGAKIPVNPEAEEASCKFCGNTFEIVRKRDGMPSPNDFWMNVIKALPFVMLGIDILMWLRKRRE